MQKTHEERLNKFIAVILIMVLTLADLIAIGFGFESIAVENGNAGEYSNQENQLDGESTVQRDLEIIVNARVGDNELQNNSNVFQGEVISYEINLKNNTKNDIKEITVSGLVPEGTSLYSTKEYTLEENEQEQISNVFQNINIKQGETVNLSYQIKINKDLAENSKIENIISTSYNDYTFKFTNYVKKADVTLELKTFGRTNRDYVRGYITYEYILEITNNTNEDIKNVILKLNNSESTTSLNTFYNIDLKEDNTILIDEIHANKTYYKTIYMAIKDINEDNQYASLNVEAIYNNNVYESNTIKDKIACFKVNANISKHNISDNVTIHSGEIIKYKLEIKNTGEYDINNLIIKDTIFDKLQIKNVTIDGKEVIYSENTAEKEDYKTLEINYDNLRKGQTVFVIIEAIVDLGDAEKQLTISNFYHVYNNITHIGESNEDKCNVMLLKEKKDNNTGNIDINIDDEENTNNGNNENSSNNNGDNDNGSSNNSNNNNNSNNDDNTSNANNGKENDASGENVGNSLIKIAGQVWNDKNETGEKSNNSEGISDIKVYLIDTATKKLAQDIKGNKIKATTEKDGKYILENIQKGKYFIIFEYDQEKYKTAEYKKAGVSENNNSDASVKDLKVNGKERKMAVTEELEVNSNIENIDLGLIEIKNFDLELTKVISKVTVSNDKETKDYEFNNTNLAKIEIEAKKINKSIINIEYIIKVKNTGEIAGNVKTIVDYLPTELEFDSNKNTNWYKKDNYLYNNSLEKEQIQPGETKEIKLLLTKQMTEDTTGLISNIAEIQEASNKFNILDIDSTPSNRKKEEDDMGQADIIITIKTGRIMKNAFIFTTMIGIVGLSIKLWKK